MLKLCHSVADNAIEKGRFHNPKVGGSIPPAATHRFVHRVKLILTVLALVVAVLVISLVTFTTGFDFGRSPRFFAVYDSSLM